MNRGSPAIRTVRIRRAATSAPALAAMSALIERAPISAAVRSPSDSSMSCTPSALFT
jgi:hypothetical protein